MTLILHRGGQEATMRDLAMVPLPEQTRTYQPVAHTQLAEMLLNMGKSIFTEFDYDHSQFGLAADGNKMFGVHTFRSTHARLGLSIGFRNSYDRSMSVGIVMGASVFVCDNLALSGELTVLRKHTSHVIRDMENMALQAIYRSQRNFEQILMDAEQMETIELHDDDAHRMLGLAFGRKIVTPRQIPIALKEWHSPSHPDFKSRTVWSLYNAFTESLKSSPPQSIMEKHLSLHQLFEDEYDLKGQNHDF